MTPNRGAPKGSRLRRSSATGETATFTTRTVSVDTSTDWDDETVTVETATVPVFIRTRTAATERDERERDVIESVTIYAHDDHFPAGFTIREPDEQPPTEIDVNGHTYRVMSDHIRPDDQHEIEVERKD